MIATRPFRRSVARTLVLFALLFATGMGSVGRASCATHGLGLSAEAPPPHAAHMAGHSATPHEHGRQHSDHSDGCCCGGECAGVAQVAAIPDSSTLRVAVLLAEPARIFDSTSEQASVQEPDRLLPFGNGPPASASV